MTDPFIDRVAELAGQTKKTLEQLADEIGEAGLQAQASTLRVIAKQHERLAYDCMTTTRPIEIVHHGLSVRIRKYLVDIDEMATDLLARGKPGHRELGEAAALMRLALTKQVK